MDFLNFLLFLIVTFSVSNAALLPLDLDSLYSSLPGPPLPDSPLPGSMSLNLPAPGHDLSPSNLNLNAIGSDNNPTSNYTPELAQEPSQNGAGDGGKSLTVPPSITYAETQTHTDDLDGICYDDSSTGQRRRKRQPNSCPITPMLEFYSKVPQKAQPGGKKSSGKREETDDMARRDNTWLLDKIKKNFDPADWEDMSPQEKMRRLFLLNASGESSCIKQSVPEGPERGYSRPFTFCCLGPRQVMTIPTSELRLARRQDTVTITNWFNCQWDIEERPFCLFVLDEDWRSHSVCCRDFSTNVGFEPRDWWRWGFQGVDCVNHPSVANPASGISL